MVRDPVGSRLRGWNRRSSAAPSRVACGTRRASFAPIVCQLTRGRDRHQDRRRVDAPSAATGAAGCADVDEEMMVARVRISLQHIFQYATDQKNTFH